MSTMLAQLDRIWFFNENQINKLLWVKRRSTLQRVNKWKHFHIIFVGWDASWNVITVLNIKCIFGMRFFVLIYLFQNFRSNILFTCIFGPSSRFYYEIPEYKSQLYADSVDDVRKLFHIYAFFIIEFIALAIWMVHFA